MRELADCYGEDLDDGIVLDEFAAYFSAVLSSGDDEAIMQVCEALERIARELPEGLAALSDHVLEALSPGLRARAAGYLGPLAETASDGGC